MIRLYSINNKIRYDIDHYVVDTIEALKNLVPSNMGDTAYVIKTAETYMADSVHDWYRIIPKRSPIAPPEEEVVVAVLGKAIIGTMILGKEV